MKKTITTGNVFADLGFSPEEAAVRAMRIELAAEIERYVGRKGLSQTAAARYFGIPQPKLNRILRGRLDGFSIDYLVRLATLAGRNPRLVFSSARRGRVEARA